jgi:hypothetical protein
MPRIYDKYNNPRDYCNHCFPQNEKDFLRTQDCLDNNDDVKCKFCNKNFSGDNGCHYGYECDHPEYSDTDYCCVICGKKLHGHDY